MAFFTNEEKRDALRGMLKHAVLDEMNRVMIEAVLADYETHIAFEPPLPHPAHTYDRINDGFTPVRSTNLAAIKYDNGEMTIRFHNGTSYLYHSVPEASYRFLIEAESVGRAFLSKVAGGGFQYEKLQDWK